MQIIDTFDDFYQLFKDHLDEDVEDLIIRWEQYISNYPELEIKCKSDYLEFGYDWVEIATTKVFNRTKLDFNLMNLIHNRVKKLINPILLASAQTFHVEHFGNIVLYCGLGNGAGWVDTYQGKRAILFGLEKIAELNISQDEDLKSLIAHELCHVIHFELRGTDCLEGELTLYHQGIWQLYIEGFAQYYQSKLLEQSDDYRGSEWVGQCAFLQDELKKLFLEGLTHEEIGIQKFFGDWFEVMGVQDAGYFLGAKMIEELSEQYTIEEIACLDLIEIESNILRFLKS